MAFYTHDGVRHNTKQEAAEYMEQNFISNVPPFKDALHLALHKHDWGRFDIQAVPDDSEDPHVYLELYETLTYGEDFGGANLIRYSDLENKKSADELIALLTKESKFISMVGSEVKERLISLQDDDKFFYNEEAPLVVINYSIEVELEETVKVISYEIDGVFDGVIELRAGVDALGLLLDDILSHFIVEVEGEFKPEGGTIGKYKLDHMLDSALKTGRELAVRLVEPTGA